MTTTIKITLAAQSKAVVPSVTVESDELSQEQITEKVTQLFGKMEDIAVSYAMRRI
jgi:hypothetical protein